MAWQDKTLEAKYISPSGKEFFFTWDKPLSRETELKTGIFTFPDRDGAHVQHQGAGVRSFPLEVIFYGPDCMDTADEFEAALIERDAAELQHPIYGIVKVIPTGNIKREDNLISALNESHVTITFTETITDESPIKLEEVSADELEEKYEEFSESAAGDFAESISIESVVEELQLQSVMETQAQALDDNLSGLMAADTGALADFKTSAGELKSSIKELRTNMFSGIKDAYNNAKKFFKNAEKIVQKAINAARLALNIMKMPSRIKVNLMEKIKGYSQLITAIINQFKNDPFGKTNVKNSFASTCLVLNGCIASIASGSALSIARAAASLSSGISASRSMSAISMKSAETGGLDGDSGGGSDGDSGGGTGGGSDGDSGGGTGGGSDGDSGGGTGGGSGGGTGGGSDGDSGGGTGGGSGGGTGGGSDGDSGGGLENDSTGSIAAAAGDGGGTISREEAIHVMNQLILLFETIKNFQDAKIGNNIMIDSNSNTYLLLNELVYLSIRLIQNASFSLPMQRTIRLNRDRQVIELCCELYGSADYLDKFIAENDFNIDEIELIPMGREVTYYVKAA
jgi:hypothetical protein